MVNVRADMPSSENSIFDDIFGRESWGDREAVLEEKLTYGELLAESERLANTLRSLGVGKGSLVGICLPLGSAYIESILAIDRLGGTSIPLNPGSTANENQYIRQHSGMLFVVAHDDRIVADIKSEARSHTWKNLIIF